MSTRLEIDRAPATVWERIYRWVQALDQALDSDPIGRLQASVRHLDGEMTGLEAVSRRGEAGTDGGVLSSSGSSDGEAGMPGREPA